MTCQQDTPALQLKVRLLQEGARAPEYMSIHAAGLDIAACLHGDVQLNPGERRLIPTGIALELPWGYEGQLRPRSGLALKHGVTVLNSPGTIDADYRGEVMVLLINHGTTPFVIQNGVRIAQLIVAPVAQVTPVIVAELGETPRGSGGYGHTGS